MKYHKNLIILAFLLVSTSIFALNCHQQAQQELFNLIKHDARGILQQQYSLTALKLTLLGRTKQRKKTLEYYIRQQQQILKIDDNKTISQLNSLYRKYGINSDYQKTIESMSTTIYWKKESRFFNKDISAFILLATTKQPKGLLNTTDAAIAWFAQKISAQQKNSKQKNKTNLSTQVAFLNGQIKGFSALKTDRLQKQLQRLGNKIAHQLKDAITNFSHQFIQQCPAYFSKLCNNQQARNDLFAHSIFQFKKQLPSIKTPLLKSHLSSIINRRELSFSSPNMPNKKEIFFYQPPKIPRIKHAFVYRDIEKFKQSYNGQDNQKLIQAYHSNFLPSRYGIINKRTQEFSIYGINHQLLLKIKINIKNTADSHPPGVGAGIFYLTSTQPDTTLDLSSQKNKKSSISLKRIETKCQLSGICQSENSTDMSIIYQYLNPQDPIYILPHEDGNTFVFKNGILNFTTLIRRKNYSVYDYSPRNTKAHPIKSVITNSSYNTPDARKFVKTLQQEKATLMKLYHLDNDEYNDLMKLAFGILGNESKFGTSTRYHIKEALPFVVSLAKGNGFDTSKNSRGPTQIKHVPKLIKKHYGVTKSNLTNASNAAVATLGFLAESLQELKGKEQLARQHGLIINSLNRMNYIHYIYMGRSKEITQGTATPEKNIYYRQIRKYADSLLIIESSTDNID